MCTSVCVCVRESDRSTFLRTQRRQTRHTHECVRLASTAIDRVRSVSVFRSLRRAAKSCIRACNPNELATVRANRERAELSPRFKCKSQKARLALSLYNALRQPQSVRRHNSRRDVPLFFRRASASMGVCVCVVCGANQTGGIGSPLHRLRAQPVIIYFYDNICARNNAQKPLAHYIATAHTHTHTP